LVKFEARVQSNFCLQEYPLAPQAREFTDTVLRAFMTTIASDDDLDTVARHFESIKSLVNVGGAPIIHPRMSHLIKLFEYDPEY